MSLNSNVFRTIFIEILTQVKTLLDSTQHFANVVAEVYCTVCMFVAVCLAINVSKTVIPK